MPPGAPSSRCACVHKPPGDLVPAVHPTVALPSISISSRSQGFGDCRECAVDGVLVGGSGGVPAGGPGAWKARSMLLAREPWVCQQACTERATSDVGAHSRCRACASSPLLQAKTAGTYSDGMLNLMLSKTNVVQQQTIHTDRITGECPLAHSSSLQTQRSTAHHACRQAYIGRHAMAAMGLGNCVRQDCGSRWPPEHRACVGSCVLLCGLRRHPSVAAPPMYPACTALLCTARRRCRHAVRGARGGRRDAL